MAPLRFGEYEIHLIETGRFRLDGGAMFGVVPKVLWEKTNPADDRNRIEMALRCLLVRWPGGILLADTGIGERWNAKLRDIYGIDTQHSSLDQSLQNLGITRQQITHVIFTHLHFDHVGGATREESGAVTLSFPNATHFVHSDQWKHAHAPTPKDQASFVSDYLGPLRQSARLREVPDRHAFAPGISSWVTHGHTPGHLMVQVQQEKQTLVFCGDTIPTSSHLPLAYVMAYDLYPMTTVEEKRKLLEQAVREDWLLAFSHDPFVPYCGVTFEKGKYSKRSV